ncbi:unnamed protein product [Rotaria sp. Silwood2]|nr:unnamed protein product [Rotaria sp. Silwood2]CAF2937175.1 unnamed protein product [Rotaria sp. Silwood2]CAF3390288.1 unnamed protein product [Rotaria sp. Silwood2]CAF4326087.1 unnamed protein product [Rotaria sp. Silwood2]CAF4428396.1 unnamed protein product [Rotaria sp. Silwood2]
MKYFQVCSLTDENATVGSIGTFCGIIFSSWNILCDNLNPYSEPCPSGYSKYSWNTGVYDITLFTCQKDNTSSNDRPGTLCGFYSNQDEGNQVPCNGYYPGRGKCPRGYTLREETITNVHTLRLCVKD